MALGMKRADDASLLLRRDLGENRNRCSEIGQYGVAHRLDFRRARCGRLRARPRGRSSGDDFIVAGDNLDRHPDRLSAAMALWQFLRRIEEAM